MNCKRRFAGRGERQLPDDPAGVVFFLDHGMGRKVVVGALREAGCQVELHEDHFAIDAKDVDWLPEVGLRGWVLISKDFSIATNELERLTLLESGVRAFLLSRQDLTGPQMATALLKALRRIQNVSRSQPAPFIARVSPSGIVEVLTKLTRDWKKSRRRRS